MRTTLKKLVTILIAVWIPAMALADPVPAAQKANIDSDQSVQTAYDELDIADFELEMLEGLENTESLAHLEGLKTLEKLEDFDSETQTITGKNVETEIAPDTDKSDLQDTSETAKEPATGEK